MRIAYLDCFSGISGDMFLGALVDAGVPAEVLRQTVAELKVGARLEVSRVQRAGISATKVDVLVRGKKDRPRESAHTHHHDHPPAHSLRPRAAAAHEHRGLKEIREIISQAGLPAGVQTAALSMFEALGAAEAKIHNTSVEKVHFHEVGAADAIVDIVCAAVGAEVLGVNEWVSSPLNVGSGTVACEHGRFPVPAPATVELLHGAPVYSSGIEAELVTPTGAAIVKTLASRFSSFPAMKIAAVGYGAGTRDFPGHSNVLRLTVGEAASESRVAEEKVTVLEANLDDLNPQLFGYVLEQALAAGALDVFATPVQMKKNRPGMLLTVLAKPKDASRLAHLIFAETTTLGVRMREERREVLRRRSVSVKTPWGAVRLKVASLNGTATNFAPEYEDCRRIAARKHLPLKSVMQEAVRAYLTAHSAASEPRAVIPSSSEGSRIRKRNG
ncbi:MAG: nickel pincer cofactor biosynthesis protein LarC [Terriglobales bacterium]